MSRKKPGTGHKAKLKIIGTRTRFRPQVSESSKRYLARQSKDPYVRQAQAEGYNSRAAYKLIEINDKHRIIKPGQVIVDLGSAPGGWSQVCAEIQQNNGKIFAVDLLLMPIVNGVTFIKGDFTEPETIEKMQEWGYPGKADVVLSDMAQNTLGNARADHLQQINLAEIAAEFALQNLRPGGHFLTKIFQGGEEIALREHLKQHFKTVKFIKPASSRQESREIFLLALTFQPAGE